MRSVVSTSSVGSWKHSDLPEAVPVVTTVGPSNALSSASAWWRVEVLDPGVVKRLGDRPAELVGDGDEPSGPPLVDVVVHQALVRASGGEQRLPGLGFTECRHA